jgi:hypothetical protein
LRSGQAEADGNVVLSNQQCPGSFSASRQQYEGWEQSRTKEDKDCQQRFAFALTFAQTLAATLYFRLVAAASPKALVPLSFRSDLSRVFRSVTHSALPFTHHHWSARNFTWYIAQHQASGARPSQNLTHNDLRHALVAAVVALGVLRLNRE